MLIPQNLQNAEFVRLALDFILLESIDLPPWSWLQTRRECKAVIAEQVGDDGGFRDLIEPGPSADSMVARQWPVSPPAFVLHPPADVCYPAGARVRIFVSLFGDGIGQAVTLCRLLARVAERGFFHRLGQARLVAVATVDLQAAELPLPLETFCAADLPRQSLAWWLEAQTEAEALGWNWQSPGRMLVKGRPLFKPTWAEVVSLLRRRVACMLSLCCHVDLERELETAQEAAGLLHCHGRFRWRDWRSLQGEAESIALGGVWGNLTISGEDLFDAHWLLALGSLFNLGKGAAFGAGAYNLQCLSSAETPV